MTRAMTRDDIIGLTRSERVPVYGLLTWAKRWRLLARVERMRFNRERERAEWAVGQLRDERDEARRERDEVIAARNELRSKLEFADKHMRTEMLRAMQAEKALREAQRVARELAVVIEQVVSDQEIAAQGAEEFIVAALAYPEQKPEPREPSEESSR